MAYTLPDLPYEFDALEPHIDTKTMQIHHDLHHSGYVNKLNAALEGHDDLLDMDISTLLKNIEQVPEEKRQAVINNGGGHANHSLFWQIMSPEPKTSPEGELAEAINSTFGSLDEFKNMFTEAAGNRFGSGWAWLALDASKELQVMSTKNQDSPLLEGLTPIMGLDVWEHAYYLKYQNRRPEYIESWWNVLDWSKVEELYTS